MEGVRKIPVGTHSTASLTAVLRISGTRWNASLPAVIAAGLLFFAGIGRALAAQPGSTDEILRAWFNAQANLQTWSAEFTQTRSLKSLQHPLTARGRVWFAAPNQFRWEVGEPAQTIAVRQTDQILMIYPNLNRAERFPLNGPANGPWRDLLAMMEAGFSHRWEEWQSRFRVLSLVATNGCYELVLQPKAGAVRRLVPQIKLVCATNDFALTASELSLADGSRMRSDFTNAQRNPKLNPNLFSPQLPAGIEIVEPFGKK